MNTLADLELHRKSIAAQLNHAIAENNHRLMDVLMPRMILLNKRIDKLRARATRRPFWKTLFQK